MARHRRLFIAAAAILTALVGIFAWTAYHTSAGKPSSARAQTSSLAPAAAAPRDGDQFVESAVTLRWTWSPGLAPDEIFAVRVWYGDEAPQELWTKDTSLDAQKMIDSFSRDLGDFHWSVAVIVYSDQGGFQRMASAWSPVQTITRVHRLSLTPYPPDQQSDAAHYVLAQAPATVSGRIDFVRSFIADHTHDKRQDAFKPDYSDALQMIVDNAQGQGEMPYLQCDGQSTAMLTLLKEIGIESRLIFLYGDNATQVQEHTMLEVFNTDTQQWELNDVLNNLYFIDTGTQARASIERVVFGSLDTIAACDPSGACSPDRLQPVKDYLEAFRYGYTDTFWVNPDRFDISKRFIDNGNVNLSEYLTGNPRDFQFRFDSWPRSSRGQ